MTPRRQAPQAGQILMIFALAFALFLFAVTCLVADGAFLFRWLVPGLKKTAAEIVVPHGEARRDS